MLRIWHTHVFLFRSCAKGKSAHQLAITLGDLLEEAEEEDERGSTRSSRPTPPAADGATRAQGPAAAAAGTRAEGGQVPLSPRPSLGWPSNRSQPSRQTSGLASGSTVGAGVGASGQHGQPLSLIKEPSLPTLTTSGSNAMQGGPPSGTTATAAGGDGLATMEMFREWHASDEHAHDSLFDDRASLTSPANGLPGSAKQKGGDAAGQEGHAGGLAATSAPGGGGGSGALSRQVTVNAASFLQHLMTTGDWKMPTAHHTHASSHASVAPGTSEAAAAAGGAGVGPPSSRGSGPAPSGAAAPAVAGAGVHGGGGAGSTRRAGESSLAASLAGTSTGNAASVISRVNNSLMMLGQGVVQGSSVKQAAAAILSSANLNQGSRPNSGTVRASKPPSLTNAPRSHLGILDSWGGGIPSMGAGSNSKHVAFLHSLHAYSLAMGSVTGHNSSSTAHGRGDPYHGAEPNSGTSRRPPSYGPGPVNSGSPAVAGALTGAMTHGVLSSASGAQGSGSSTGMSMSAGQWRFGPSVTAAVTAGAAVTGRPEHGPQSLGRSVSARVGNQHWGSPAHASVAQDQQQRVRGRGSLCEEDEEEGAGVQPWVGDLDMA